MEIRKISRVQSHLVIDLFNQYRMFYKKADDRELAEKFINDRLSRNESIIFVALVTEGERTVPVGFTQLYPTYSSVSATKNWILNDLFVDGRYRSKGTGRTLIQAAMSFAKAEGSTYIQLETAFDNHQAQHLYETIGFIQQTAISEFLLYRIEV